jgi:carbamoyl-phosphate synthase large subunit
VGQNILDVLDFPGHSRRSLVQLIGTNSVADTSCNFRCDRCYLVPPTAAADYPARMHAIWQAEAPDLVLCGRDEDTYVLSRLKNEHPELPGALPIGTPHAALIGLDKWQTWLFARKHALPFAESFMPAGSDDAAGLEMFCRRVGYPLIAKPARGAGSHGVCFIRDADDAHAIARQPGYVFQEYVGDPKDLEAYFASLAGPPRLFAQFAGAGYHVCHTVIDRNGDLAPITATENYTDYGHSIANRRVLNPELDALTAAYARALFHEGGTGPISVQLRRDRRGAWKAVEINLRTSGGTVARLLRGTDELYDIVKAFVPGSTFPPLRMPDAADCDLVVRQYYTYAVPSAQVSTLKRFGVWSRS